MFYIGFTSGPRIDADGRRHALGEITMGDASAGFDADLHSWTVADYEAQWREAVARLATDVASSALITSYRGPGATGHVMWPMWREGATVFIQARLVVDDLISGDNVSEQFYDRVRARSALNDEGAPISEWRLPLGQVLAFVVDE